MNVQWDLSDGLFDEPPAAPPVLGAAAYEADDEAAGAATPPPTADISGDLTDMSVYVPAHPGVDGGENTVRFELRYTSAEEPSLVAFTSTEQLVGQLGGSQPWIRLTMGRLQKLSELMGVATISVDPTMPSDMGRWTEGDIRAFEE